MEEFRKSSMMLNKAYFYTATINSWIPLLVNDFKDIIMDSLLFLKKKKLVEIYGYVIMPNHIHLLWRLLEMNGKEMPSASLLKFTAHEFKKQIGKTDFNLEQFKVDVANKQYEFWQRDSWVTDIYSRSIAEQKLIYIHHNPLQPHWSLCTTPEEYQHSSASFYSKGNEGDDLLTHYLEVF